MPRYIDADALQSKLQRNADLYKGCNDADMRARRDEALNAVAFVVNAPTADVVEIETLKAWLYEIAMNNVGCNVDDFASACEEIALRLDGLRAFARERRNDE